MKLAAYVDYEIFRIHAFAAWWQASHQHAVGCAEHGSTPDDMWPLDHESAEYDEGLQTFVGFEIQDLPPEAQATAVALIPESYRHYLTDKTMRTC